MFQKFLVMLNGKPIKSGKKFFENEVAELKFEQSVYAKYAVRDEDFVEVLYR